MNSEGHTLLAVKGIVKRYPGVVALDGVSLDLRAGEVHCIVGENGAGKSTLMKILAGATGADEGTITLDGVPVRIDSPVAAQRLGISVIHQELKVVPELSVAENILLGNEPTRPKSPFIDRAALLATARSLLEQLGESIDVTRRVRDLSTAEQQMVEIAKAISRKVRILILDEPTAPLTDHEIHSLFGVIRRLKAESVGVIYISHRLEEIFEIGDRVTVLRDGSVVDGAPIGSVDRQTLIRWMVGRELEQEFPALEISPGEEILRVEHLSAGMIQDVSFSVRRGELFGLAGLVGAGRSELARTMFGADRRDGGRLVLEGREINPRSPREAIDCGIGLLTEDRNRYGLILEMNVRENISLANLGALTRGGFVNRRREAAVAAEYSARLRIKAPDVDVPVDSLSGGNRQKVVLARWLFSMPKLLVFDEPTAGVDVGVKFEIYTLMGELARQGIGIIVISSDLNELIGISSRIGVMCEGRLTGIVEKEDATKESILSLATQFRGHHASVA
jgi:ribose transport system ATP-binding protein